ncbi:MAG: acyl carrier protein, partial [candidate division Zixibacteria bacterium]|nr:acyl carrier protein [candidate division Zixibacteria bacterium]
AANRRRKNKTQPGAYQVVEREQITAEILRLLRCRALAGSNRDISIDAPLGEAGLGLDSLAMVEFITALEKTFEVEFPEIIWVDREKFTPGNFVEIIIGLQPKLIPAKIIEEGTIADSKLSSERTFSRLVHGAINHVYERDRYFILAYDLLHQQPHPYRYDMNLTLKEASLKDKSALSGMWQGNLLERKLALFEKRLASGYICLTAWHQNLIVGIDWLSATGDKEPYTGLEIRMNSGSCYGFDLNEHPQYKGKGVGLATLAFSLAVAKERSFRTQFTIVHTGNRKMLTAAVQIFGFKRVGTILTTRILGKPRSLWTLEGKHGHSPLLQL